jgi:ABC-2 type transport system ATP-binding protein
VGPNGAGKTTLMNIAANLLQPTAGTIRVFGAAPGSTEAGRRTAFLAQEKPLFRRFTVAETLRMGRELNPGWDQRAAENIVRAGNVPFEAKIGTLSGGQRTRVAFALAFGKRPDLLLLDEPMSDLDPLVRHELMGTLMAEAAERGTTVLMSSHMLAELENVCDYLVVIAGADCAWPARWTKSCTAHALVTGRQGGRRRPAPQGLADHTVVESRTSGRQVTALIRPDGPGHRPVADGRPEPGGTPARLSALTRRTAPDHPQRPRPGPDARHRGGGGMSILTSTSAPGPDRPAEAAARHGRPRPRLSGLTWLVWRQHRAAFWTIIAATASPWRGSSTSAQDDRLPRPPTAGPNQEPRRVGTAAQRTSAAVQHGVPRLSSIPILLGVFLGAPLLAGRPGERHRQTRQLPVRQPQSAGWPRSWG